MEFAGLRYFNVFGPRQDPDGPYAAVIPIWVSTILRGEPIVIYGDGETTRDFTYVANVVQANLLAATAPSLADPCRVYNVAIGGQTSLNQLFSASATNSTASVPNSSSRTRSTATSGLVTSVIPSPTSPGRGTSSVFSPTHDLAEGLALAMAWYAASGLEAATA